MKKTLLFKFLALSLFMLFGIGVLNAQVFITELADPNNNADVRYIELFNAGSSAVDFTEGTGWRIDKYTNASATVSQTLSLTGSIPAGGYYIIATGTDDGDFFTVYGVNADQFDGTVNDVAGSNGDDNLELYNGSDVLIDQFGVPGEDGTGTAHEFEDGRAERKATVTSGNTTWDVAEWDVDNDSGGGDGTQDAPDAFDPGAWIGDVLVATDLFFSEYIEGGSYNKALEIFNGTGTDIDLSNYVIRGNHNGSAWEEVTSFPVGTIIANGDVYVLAHELANASILAKADSIVLDPYGTGTSNVANFNGDDVRALCKVGVSDTTIIDIIGLYDLADPGSAWNVAGVADATKDHTLVRKGTVTEGNTDWAAAAGTNADDSEWIVEAKDYIDNLGIHTFGESSADVTAPTFTSTPDDGDTEVAVDAVIVLTFNEAIRNIDDSDITDENVATLLTLKETDASGSDVAFTATIDAAKKVITVTPNTDLKNDQVYYGAIISVEDTSDNASAASSMTFTTEAVIVYLSLPLYEGFDYTADETLGEQVNWNNLFSGDEVLIETGSLSYPDFHSSSGNSISFNGGGFDPQIEFEAVTSGTVYSSFLFKVTDQSAMTDLTDGGYFAFLGNYDARLWVRPNPDAAGTTFDIGFGWESSAPSTTTTTYNVGDVILAVISYNIDTDELSAWINPSSSDFGADTAPTALLTSTDEADVTSISAFVVRQDSDGETPFIQMDELRIGTSWAEVVVGSGVGIDDLSGSTLNIYPNPSTGRFYLQMGDAFKANTKVEVFNVVGMKVFETLATAYKTEIDLSAMKQGVYYVRIDDGQNIITQKIMKQ